MAANLLEQLIHPLTHKTFMADYWQQKIAISHGPLSRLPKPLSNKPLNDLNSLLSVYKGPANFSRGSKSPNALSADSATPHELYRMGLTLYLGDVAPYIPESTSLLQTLENNLGLPQGSARCGVFASPAGEGAPCHYDTEDVFSIQLTGTKTFEVAPMTQIKNPVGMQYSPGQRPYTDLYPQVSEGFPNWKNAKFKKIKMQPGSVLYMPRGTWHKSLAHEDSMAISIILNPPIVLDVALNQLRKLLLQDENWRAPMVDSNNTIIETLLTQLPALANQLSAQDMKYSLSPYQTRLENINTTSRFIRRPDAKLVAHKTDQQKMNIQNRAGDGRFETVGSLDFNDEMLSLGKWINQQKVPFMTSQLLAKFDYLQQEQVVGLLKVLVQSNVIEELPFTELYSHGK